MASDFYCDSVLNNKVTISKVKETETVLAFYHTKPSYKIHIMVIPKQHITQLSDVADLEIIKDIFAVIIEVTKQLNLKTFRIVSNSGEYQDSKHLHFHIISE